MSPDELAAAFDDLARVDPEIRIDGTRAADGTVTAHLAAGRSHPDSWRRFHSHAIDAARLFDPGGQGDPVERWLYLVWKNAPELISGDLLGGAIKDAAGASAIVVRRLRDAVRAVKPVELVTPTLSTGDDAAVRAIAEQQVREAAALVIDVPSLLQWARIVGGAGWRRSDGTPEYLIPEGPTVYRWLLGRLGKSMGLGQVELERVACGDLGLAWHGPETLDELAKVIKQRFPKAAAYLPADVKAEPTTRLDESDCKYRDDTEDSRATVPRSRAQSSMASGLSWRH